MASARHIVVAINPNAAFGKNARVGDAVVAQVVAAGHEVTVCRERDYASLREATAQAIKTADALLVVGGDGMVSLGINLVAQSRLPLGVIPAGTGNDFARFTRLPLANPDAAVRHFLATLDRDPAEAKQKLDAALADLTAGKKDFAALVSELSEDEGSKPRGGDLGWMTRDRLPADFTLPVFALEAGKPALIHSKLGWHLVEVTARKPAAPAEFETLKPEIVAALGARKKQGALARFREQLRQKADGRIEILQPI